MQRKEARREKKHVFISPEWRNKGIGMHPYTHTHFVTLAHCVSRCTVGWRGYRCEIVAASMDSSASNGSKSHTVLRVLLVKHALWSCLLMLFACSQVLPPSSSRCFCCCYWHCWWLVPSCGTSGECAGESRVSETLHSNSTRLFLTPILSSFSFSLTLW